MALAIPHPDIHRPNLRHAGAAAAALVVAMVAVVSIQIATDSGSDRVVPADTAVSETTTVTGTGHPGVLPGGDAVASAPALGSLDTGSSTTTIVDQQAQLQAELEAIRAGGVVAAVPEAGVPFVHSPAELQAELEAIRAGALRAPVADPATAFGDDPFADAFGVASVVDPTALLPRADVGSDADWIAANGWN